MLPHLSDVGDFVFGLGLLALGSVAVELGGGFHFQSLRGEVCGQSADDGAFLFAVYAPVSPEKQQHRRSLLLSQGRRTRSEIVGNIKRRSGLAGESEQVEVLLQPGANGSASVGNQSAAKKRGGLSTLTLCCQNLGFDFEGGSQGNRQVRLGIEGALLQHLPRRALGLLGVVFSLIQLIGRQRGTRHPGKRFKILGIDTVLGTVSFQLGAGGGKIALGKGGTDIIEDFALGESNKQDQNCRPA